MDLKTEIESMDVVVRAIDRVKRIGRFAEFTLSNGIVLSLKPVPPFLLAAVQSEYQTPDPPSVYMEEKGRDEPNPNDPAYIQTLERLEQQQQLALNSLILAVGTSVKFVPEGYSGPEESTWFEGIHYLAKASGVEIDLDAEDEKKRYLLWLRYYALENSDDTILATTLPLQLGGIREGEVSEVLDSFRSLPQRGTDPDSSPEAGSSNGNSDNRAARRAGARSRRT